MVLATRALHRFVRPILQMEGGRAGAPCDMLTAPEPPGCAPRPRVSLAYLGFKGARISKYKLWMPS